MPMVPGARTVRFRSSPSPRKAPTTVSMLLGTLWVRMVSSGHAPQTVTLLNRSTRPSWMPLATATMAPLGATDTA